MTARNPWNIRVGSGSRLYLQSHTVRVIPNTEPRLGELLQWHNSDEVSAPALMLP